MVAPELPLATDDRTRTIFSKTAPSMDRKEPPPRPQSTPERFSVHSQGRDDVLYSVQLAQRGVSGTYNRFTHPDPPVEWAIGGYP